MSSTILAEHNGSCAVSAGSTPNATSGKHHPRRLAVFCGSNAGIRPDYAQAAVSLARTLSEYRVGLVYGGSSVGLMQRLAAAAISFGVEVTGVIPRSLVAREGAQVNLAELRIVESMHERKATMAELSEGFIVLPGGLGTLEELFEVVTWAQLGMHSKPCGILNVAAYYDRLLNFLDYAEEQGFVYPSYRRLIAVSDEPHDLLDQMERLRPVPVRRWITAETS